MAKQNEVGVHAIATVLHTDNDPTRQPKGTHRYALNAVNETTDGKQRSKLNEKSFLETGSLTQGFFPIGDKYISDDTSVVISVNPVTGVEEIGLIDRNSQYTTHVSTKVLGLSINNQCELVYRLRRGNERVIYWVDGNNKPRTYNLDRPHNFYNTTYKTYLQNGGNPALFTGEKWDANSFDLIKSYNTIPSFSNIDTIESGSILPGSYNFAIQYVDEDLNPTDWITTSNAVNIFNDSINSNYEKIRGSKNTQTDAQNFGRSNKSIKLTLTNLDTSFPFYRIAIIQATGGTGRPSKVLHSEVQSTTDSIFIYSGNDSQLTEGSLEEILIDKEVIFAPKHIAQIENRLLLGHTKGKGINWCDFQKYASKIGADLTTKEVSLNNVLSEGNIKNIKSTFLYRGYMPGEVYSFGIAYIFDDGTISPVFHIPGKNPTNTTSKMKVYEGQNRYQNIHNCSTDNYWARDIEGDTLLGKRERHHRFPFRKDVNEPLYTRVSNTTNTNKYRLTIRITVNSAYPTDGNGDPQVIPFTINYRVLGDTINTNFSSVMVDTDAGKDIIIYDEITELDNVFSGSYAQLDPTCEMAVNYSSVFTITRTYQSYIANTTTNDDKSKIFGIEFSNIQKPHPDVVGFYIMRNERTDDDRMVLDNAILSPTVGYGKYKSFGLFTPRQMAITTDCDGNTYNPPRQITYHNRSYAIFNPEYQFLGKKHEFDKFEVEGKYTQSSIDIPIISNDDGRGCNGPRTQLAPFNGPLVMPTDGNSRGLYINDVQAGTSYNPEVHKDKDKDDDGFDLLVGYKNTNFTYAIDNVTVLPTKKRLAYLNAASYTVVDNDIYYNTSIDNKIAHYITNTDIDTTQLYNAGFSKLYYGSMTRNLQDAYSNFTTRPYYKEHNNPFYFGSANTVNGIKVFNGDAYISACSPVSSVFYDIVVALRAKKSSLWKIILGAILVVAAIAAAVVTGGASLVGIGGTLTSLAISYGVSAVTSGIKFEQFKKMVDEDYSKGLKETIYEHSLFTTIRDSIQRDDDTIRWFSDRINNIYIESSIPIGLRAGITFGTSDFMDAPSNYNEEEFRAYLTEKFTSLDRDQGSGRLYKGYAGAEFYDINLDYMRFNKEKIFSHLPTEYDCCTDKNEVYPMRWWWSEQSFQEEKIDNYRAFLPNNYKDIEGEHGEITGMYRLGNNLFIQTREALWQVPANHQERVTGDIVSFIGTGEFFSIPPKKVLDDDLGSAGTQHKWARVKTSFGVFSVDELEHKIFLHGDGVKDITIGNTNWFKNNLKPFLFNQLSKERNVEFLHQNNPANPDGIGYISTYDKRHERVIVTKKDYLILQNKIGQLIVTANKPTGGTDFVYCLTDGFFYQNGVKLSFSNPDYFENKSWTMSYSLLENGFVGWHSYVPNYYIHTKNNCHAFEGSKIFKFNREGHFQTYFNKYAPYIVEFVICDNPLVDTTFEDLTLQTVARRWDSITGQYIENTKISFNKIICSNSKQSTGEQLLKAKELQTNSVDWYKEQTANTLGVILMERKEGDWNINDIRDYVVDYDKPLFSSAWNDIKFQYPIDKVVNPQAINFTKNWEDLQVLRDKYIVVRLKFDNFNDVNLAFNYSISTTPISE